MKILACLLLGPTASAAQSRLLRQGCALYRLPGMPGRVRLQAALTPREIESR